MMRIIVGFSGMENITNMYAMTRYTWGKTKVRGSIEGGGIDPHTGNTFCLFLHERKILRRIEEYTGGIGTVRNMMSTHRRIAFMKDRYGIVSRLKFRSTVYETVFAVSDNYTDRGLFYPYEVGCKVVVTYDNDLPYGRRGFRSTKYHNRVGFCVGGNDRYMYILMDDAYGASLVVRVKEYGNVRLYDGRRNSVGRGPGNAHYLWARREGHWKGMDIVGRRIY